MLVTCLTCGTPLPPDAATCPACGTPVVKSVASSGPSTMVSARRASSSPEAPAVTAAPAEPPAPHASGPSTALSARQRPAPIPTDTAPSVKATERLSNRYLLKQKIGEGGMGTVFVAYDTELDREVAVKMLAANLVNDAEVMERFEREARLTAKLDHPNIVPIYDVGRHEGRPFLVMKLLQGDTLTGLLRTKGGFTSDETLKLMKQVAAGLDYLHGKGFIHRDIKSGNIFIAPDGHATILDFGILRTRQPTSTLTRSGMVMGTPHYMAPEQAMGLKDVDHRVDLYALAVVLFEVLTGTLPFEADSELRLIHMQAHSPPPEIIDRAPWIPKPVADVVKKGLSKKPDDRFSSGAEFLRALESSYRDSGGHTAAPKSPAPVGVTTNSGLRVLPKLSPGTSSPRLPAVKPSSTSVPAVAVEPRPSGPKPVATGADEPLGDVSIPVGQPSRRPVLVALSLVAVAAVALGVWRPWASGTGVVDRPTTLTPDAAVATLTPPRDAGDDALDDAGALAEAPDAGSEADAGTALVEAPQPLDGGRTVAVNGTGKRRHGQLNIITMHAGEPYWAQVSIDGVPRGRTPLLLDLPAGRYQMRVERAGFRVEERTVLIGAGKKGLVKIDLSP
ncbi:MAG: protein kinase [Myxococcaceae bacterium]|nr:protein kinase [Myxococcaceae bacterium]